MATTTSTRSDLASTIASLEMELPQLQDRQGALETELAAVTQRFDAVRTALTGLKALAGTPEALPEPAPEPAQGARDTATATTRPAASEQASTAKTQAVPAPRRAAKTTAHKKAKASKRTAGRRKAQGAVVVQERGDRALRKPDDSIKTVKTGSTKRTRTPGLSRSIVTTLTAAGKPLRAGEVNEALGREKTNANVSSVRTALERLAANRDVHRVGRGLYETK